MPRVHIKRLRNPIEVDTATAESISAARWGNPKEGVKANHPDSPLKLQNYEGSLGDVVSIDYRSEKQRSSNMEEYHASITKEYNTFRERRLAMSPLKRAQNLKFFEFVWVTFTGTPIMPENARRDAMEVQIKFFENNPDRIYCDPDLFRPIIPKDAKANAMGIRLIEGIIKQDIASK